MHQIYWKLVARTLFVLIFYNWGWWNMILLQPGKMTIMTSQGEGTVPCCIWSQQLRSNWCELQNGYCFTSTFHIPIQISFLVHPTGKQAGKWKLGSVVQPGQVDTSPSQHTQLLNKLSLLEGLIRRAFIRNSHLPPEQVHWFGTKLRDHTQRREVTASSGCGCMSYDLHR